MRVKFDRYKDGKRKALTMSYDDGNRADLRLLEIFNKYGIKGTFHLNSGLFSDWTVTPEEIKTCYAGHEISAHSLTHHFMECTPNEEVFYEVLEDRRRLEEICGHPICGASYPQGTYSPELVEMVRMLGWRYCRTTKATQKLNLPDDFVLWHPTCHHKDPDLMTYLEKLKAKNPRPLALLYVWGHSFEFDKKNNWELIENFCREAGGDPDIWYATNIEIYDYVTALRTLRFSADRSMVQNPTATDVWISAKEDGIDGSSVCIKIPAGALVNIANEVKKFESEAK